MCAVRLLRKPSAWSSPLPPTDTNASVSVTGVKGTATTLLNQSGVKQGSALENKLLFQIRATKLPEPVREVRFIEHRRWRADFAWPDKLLIVEVEGGVWMNGRHTRGKGFEADCEKYNEAALAGWNVIRVTSTHIRTGEALDWIRRALS